MDRRQRNRLLIFLLVPVLAAILYFADDQVIRLITLILIVVYIAIIIFLRDSIRFDSRFGSRFSVDRSEPEIDLSTEPAAEDLGDSFKIISKNKTPEIITQENFNYVRGKEPSTVKPTDLRERFEEIANEALPPGLSSDEQFKFVLEKILAVIKEVYMAHTAVFFWYNKKKDKLLVERFVSNSVDLERRTFNLEDDILSNIVKKGEPELLSDIPPTAEADAIRYYNSPQGIRSFVGVPLFYDKSLIAIIAVDSKANDAFGIETIYALGRFVRVITMIIAIFEEKHSDTISQQRLKGLVSIIGEDVNLSNPEELFNSLFKSLSITINWDAFAFIFYDPVKQNFQTQKVINNTSLKYIGENLEIELSGTITGKAITTGIPIKVDDTAAGEFIRYSKIEDLRFDGSFLALPLVYNNQNFGVLCFDSLKKNAFSNSDVQFLKSITNIISFIVFSYSNQKLLKSLLAVDLETRILNEVTFKVRMSEELQKANHLKIPGAVALIRIDDFLEQESLFDGNPLPKVLVAVAELIKSELNAFNVFGRIGEKEFGVYFFNHTTKEVFLWAERLRVKIARKPIAVMSKQSSYTVSIGVAPASNKTNPDEVLYNADLALKRALEKGGNSVRVI
ncbi:MAG: GAF domain-containing protein [Ignavibacteriaceae bacterium]|nr:GAF domain-containing protein [Ignavibacteriaceae bacterium]